MVSHPAALPLARAGINCSHTRASLQDVVHNRVPVGVHPEGHRLCWKSVCVYWGRINGHPPRGPPRNVDSRKLDRVGVHARAGTGEIDLQVATRSDPTSVPDPHCARESHPKPTFGLLVFSVPVVSQTKGRTMIAQRALATYTEWLRRQNKPVYRPQPLHRCRGDTIHACRLVEVMPTVFVCETSLAVHECGEKCREGVHTVDGDVCRLTGVALPIHKYVLTIRPSKDNSRVMTGTNYIRMGKKGKRSGKQKRRTSTTSGRVRIHQSLAAFMTGADRVAMYAAQLNRFRADMLKIMRSVMTNGLVDHVTANTRGTALHHRIGALLNPPLPDEHLGMMESLAGSFAEYYERISPHISGRNVPKTIPVFVACLSTMLSVGYTIGTTVIVPKLQIFEYYAPTEVGSPACCSLLRLFLTPTISQIQYGDFPDVTCQNMSSYLRAFRRACVTQKGAVRFTMIYTPSSA